MRVIGFAGWSGAGKTTLIVKLIPELNRRGLQRLDDQARPPQFRPRPAGQGFYEHRAAGAEEVLVASANRVALMRELRGAPEPSLAELFRLLKDVDLVLVEGFKRDPLPKIEVFRAANGKPPLYPDDPNIVALISDSRRSDASSCDYRRDGSCWTSSARRDRRGRRDRPSCWRRARLEARFSRARDRAVSWTSFETPWFARPSGCD